MSENTIKGRRKWMKSDIWYSVVRQDWVDLMFY